MTAHFEHTYITFPKRDLSNSFTWSRAWVVAKWSPDDDGDEDEGLGEADISCGELENLPVDDTLSTTSLASEDIIKNIWKEYMIHKQNCTNCTTTFRSKYSRYITLIHYQCCSTSTACDTTQIKYHVGSLFE